MQSIPIFVQVLISLGGVLMPLLLFYLKIRYDNKQEKIKAKKEQERLEIVRDLKEDKRIEKQTKFLSDRILEVELKVTNLEEILKVHIGESEFKLGFQNKVSDMIMVLLRASDLDMEYKSILNYWFIKIEKLCIDFYYSSLRKREPKRLENMLLENFELLLGEYNRYIDVTIKEVRLYNENKFSLSKFLEKTSFFGKSRVLINSLIINGLDENKFSNLVINHLDTFYSDFIQMLRVWKRLKKQSIFNTNEEEAA